MYECMHACMYVTVYVCMYVRTYVCMYAASMFVGMCMLVFVIQIDVPAHLTLICQRVPTSHVFVV